ncbi:efflux transporter outer membrane subunit [Trinickia caryophylli]|uniref:Efflux transporter, outer membrane factor (OMF) lipoprotein, NodT family n=1 Tax=Trinickia caryophylli TaxID=28094 RepID=A0A1X7GJV0_TRICW|nr:efflux transporter outer membrane subunit [Trinickia caryophylli]PMS09894.1 RND transporter [Trinickia caryophylli]TRX14930.1 efflux transporter outer membrane subunit [Trinickia caryophylli]WQE14784.1 efflux transporter outer membrane subunit [Trinickia caryophylli]SMF70428.1 efflux transporter, outer membrane factor (OMF) lipoprotein, NodT family [Trinickia caryophylli]GLU34984.1 RND transporter [Trinickia caryophylli]
MNALAKRFAHRSLIACATALCTACSTLPPYVRPTVDVPPRYAGAPANATGNWTQAAPADHIARGPWWMLFHDDTLDRLEARIDVSNEPVQEAVAQLQAARAALDYQRAGYLPTIGADVDASRTRLSQNVLGHSLAGRTVPDYGAGIVASWEPDLFGRVKDEVTGAAANAQASRADLESVRLAMTSELALDYFDLRALDVQKALLDRTVTAYGAALRIVEQQWHDGAIDESAVAQARTQLDSTRTQDTDLDERRARLLHAIATLVGVPASSFALSPDTSPVTVPDVPAGVPSQLLERRPDIAAAERRVAAANARIGSARAAWYPNLQLTADAGLESTFFAPWLTAPSLFWSLGAQLGATLFDGGRRHALEQTARADYDATVADYRQTVLLAFQQVEDDLSSLHTLAGEAATQGRATSAAQLSLSLTTNRYQAGAVSYLDVVTAQTIALANERTQDDIAARRVDATVRLIAALGGGWRRRE